MQQSEVELQVSSQTFTPASLVQRNDTLVAYNAGVVEMCVFIARIQAWYNYSMLLRNDVHVGLPVLIWYLNVIPSHLFTILWSHAHDSHVS